MTRSMTYVNLFCVNRFYVKSCFQLVRVSKINERKHQLAVLCDENNNFLLRQIEVPLRTSYFTTFKLGRVPQFATGNV